MPVLISCNTVFYNSQEKYNFQHCATLKSKMKEYFKGFLVSIVQKNSTINFGVMKNLFYAEIYCFRRRAYG